MWKSGLGSAATYRALMEIFVRVGRVDCAETIVNILKEGADDTHQPDAIEIQGSYHAPVFKVPLSHGGIDLPSARTM